MPLCPSLLQNATCSSEGCLCRDRRRSYPSDLSDAEWAVLEPQAREVMRELVRAEGRPMVHDLRAMCDAVAYVVRNGIEWRAVPVDFPNWDSVYAFYERWSSGGCRRRWSPGCGNGCGRSAAGTGSRPLALSIPRS